MKYQIVRNKTNFQKYDVLEIDWFREVGRVVIEGVTFEEAQDWFDYYTDQQ